LSFQFDPTFWGPALKYLGVGATAISGVIGTVFETRIDDGPPGSPKRLGWPGKVLVVIILLSSIVGVFGVVIDR
jgi:hypothetical protein